MLPAQRKTRTQTRNGRAHHALRARQGVKCPNCRATKLPHAACGECGYVRPGLKIELTREQ